MTERLYFNDSYLREFESEVVACASAGDRFEAVLKATAFYPTGGGQPHDAGTLGERTVLDVTDREGDGIVHVLDGPLEVGARVRGRVDWRRRFDHMQQHSGQHLLSAAFESVCGARTESFHLGTATSTIDLDRLVSAPQIAAAEDEVNRIVWEDREVRLKFASAGEASSLPLRKESGREGILRLIEMEGFDLSACGGTHVSRTGAVGLISVLSSERFKGGTRIEFVCGGRALSRLREWRDVFAATSRTLSVLPAALPAAVERLQAENKAAGKALRDWQDRLAVHEGAALIASGEATADGRIQVVKALEGWDATGLKAIATAAIRTPQARVALFTPTSPALVVVARGAEGRIDASAVVKGLVARFGGKGGGKSEMAQAGGLAGDVAEMLRAANDLLAVP